MTPEEAEAIAQIVANDNCCGFEARIMTRSLIEKFPEHPWAKWYDEHFGEGSFHRN